MAVTVSSTVTAVVKGMGAAKLLHMQTNALGVQFPLTTQAVLGLPPSKAV